MVNLSPADLNGDGLTDVVGIDATGNLVSALGRGDGTFSSAYTVAGSSISAALATGDFNGDGKVDVVGISESQPGFSTRFFCGERQWHLSTKPCLQSI